ncbi:MAG: transcriptional repressor LexA [Deltaproteobacteria bacterium]|jgi:repressor LexA|nr:transcriptional repressor LexA [Deltaproteobacteria bacterium]
MDIKLKGRLDSIKGFYIKSGRMPTYSEMTDLFGVKSKNAVFKIVGKLIEKGFLKKDSKGYLLPVSGIYADTAAMLMTNASAIFAAAAGAGGGLIKLLGSVEAGFPSPAEEELLDSISIDKLLIKNPNSSFMLEVSGDSMINVGIMPKDFVVVDKSLTPKEGDIVIARVDGDWTIKYLRKDNGKYILEAANPKYGIITPKQELTVAGVVVGTIRKYK